MGPGFTPEELDLIRARFTLLDVFGQLMLKKYADGVDDYDYQALAQIILNVYLELKEKGLLDLHAAEQSDESQ